MTLCDFNTFYTVESSYKKELVCQILCSWVKPFPTEKQSTKIVFLGMHFAVNNDGVCGFPTKRF